METRPPDVMLQGIARGLEGVRDELVDVTSALAKTTDKGKWAKIAAVVELARDVDELLARTRAVGAGRVASEAAMLPATRMVQEVASVGVKPGKKARRAYPKYMIRGDHLVKIGLARDGRREYQHVVPRAEFDGAIVTLHPLATSQKEFRIEDLVKSVECPSYRSYIVLGLLRKLGFVKSKRRGVYGFTREGARMANPASIWDALKTREGEAPSDQEE